MNHPAALPGHVDLEGQDPADTRFADIALSYARSCEASQTVKATALSKRAKAEQEDDSSWEFVRQNLRLQADEAWQVAETYSTLVGMLEADATYRAKTAGVL